MISKKKKIICKRKQWNKKPGYCDTRKINKLYHLSSIATGAHVPKMMNRSARLPDIKCPYRNAGLSSKEKNFVICSCQSRSARYILLKNLAQNAIRDRKIFTINGTCNVVRKELVERGWVEKCTSKHMNLSKLKKGCLKTQNQIDGELEKLLLSSLVSKHPPNFIWHSDGSVYRKIERAEDGTTIENKLMADTMWTTKQGLCSSMKRNYWFYIEDVSEVTAPRSYNTYDSSEVDDFDKDYKITACTSLLKWVLSMIASKRPVFIASGKISSNILLFALNRCKEYLFRKQNRDIDGKFNDISDGQWDTFLRKYYQLIGREDVFQTDVEEDKLKLYLGYTKFLLKEILRYRPQLNCEGCHNIWIIKPAHDCRGRGIRMASKLKAITDLIQKSHKNKYVIQKYIEEPLLIHETKFDIRQYYLVTSTYPLVIWMYEDCYLKFSSQKYNVMNYHESIHLTNNAVQRKYRNCAERHPELPIYNMWDLDKYKSYLNSIGQNKTWDNIIYPGMRKAIIGIMLSCQDSITTSKNRFELYGCDFILDKMYTPWLIEINSRPDLQHTTPVTAKICPAVIADIIKVIVDYRLDENASTGKFECIYNQPMTTPRYGPAIDLCVRGYSLPYNYFYHGVIPTPTCSYENVNINADKVNKSVLTKMKRYTDMDTITVDEEDSSFVHINELYRNDSEDEETPSDKNITSQLEKLMDKISVDNDYCCNSLFRTESIDSINRIESALKKSMTRIASAVHVCCFKREESDKVLRITESDNDTVKKVSEVSLDAIKKIFEDYEIAKQQLLKNKKAIMPVASNGACKISDSKSIMLEATSDIVQFINKKEREYMNYVNVTLNKPT